MPVTRLVTGLYGGRLAGPFAGKGALAPGTKGEHSQRIVSGLWAGRLTGSFAGKTGTVTPPVEDPELPIVVGTGGSWSGRVRYGHLRGDSPLHMPRRNERAAINDDDEILLLVAQAWMELEADE